MAAEIDWTAPTTPIVYPPGVTINPFYGYSFGVPQDGQMTVTVATGSGAALNLVQFTEQINGLTIVSNGGGAITMTGLASQVVSAIVSGVINYTTPANKLLGANFADGTDWTETGYAQTPVGFGNGAATFTDPSINTTPGFFQFGQKVTLGPGSWQLSFSYSLTQGASRGYYGLPGLSIGWFLNGVGNGSDPNAQLPAFNVSTSTSGIAVLDFTLSSAVSDWLTFEGGNSDVAISGLTLLQVAPVSVTITSAGSFDEVMPGTSMAPSQTISTQDVSCFLAGSRILTARGEIAVQDLRVGDLAVTLRTQGGGPGLAPIGWIGETVIDLDRHPRPERVAAIRVSADAFAPGMPHRDLFLSPDHAVWLEGQDRLVPVHLLVNGATIRRESSKGLLRYFHIELPRHAVLLADGLPAESYLDTGNRGLFDGQTAPRPLHPDLQGETEAGQALATWAAAGCAELLLSGPELRHAHHRLLVRATALGHRRETDARPRITAGGATLPAIRTEAGLSVVLPVGTASVRLHSASMVPSQCDAAEQDHRRLGVPLAGTIVDGRRLDLGIALGAGFHPVEREGDSLWAWSDGDAEILVPPGAGELTVVLHRFGTRYWVATADESRAAEAA